MNNTTINVHVQVFVGTCVFNYLGHITRSKITGSHGNFMFKILKNSQTLFKVIAPFYFPSAMYKDSSPHQNPLLFVFLMKAILVGMKSYLIVVLICISLMAKDNLFKRKIKRLSFPRDKVAIKSLMSQFQKRSQCERNLIFIFFY